MIRTPLFESQNLWLTAIDPAEDARIESGWTYDLNYAQHLLETPARPLGALELKKKHEETQKKVDEQGNQYGFAIRLKEDDQLAGFVRFPFIFWVHSSAWLRLGIADPGILERFGREALDLALYYGFRELNLYRIETVLPANQADFIALFEQAGFLLEVRRRQAFYRDGRYYDALHFGMLQVEWQAAAEEVAA